MSRKVTQLDDNYIEFDNLPRKKDGKIDWLKSVGCKLKFKYCNVNGILTIKETKRKNNITILTISYNNKTLDIQPSGLKRCQLGKLLSNKDSNDILIKWNYNIGDHVIDDLFIIDRKIINASQYYKISCKRCGFKSQDYYVVKNKELKHIEEYWCLASTLKELKGCPCCSKKSSIVVTGINDIATTDPWMMDYIVDKTDAQKYSAGSNSKILMRCRDCKSERLYKPSSLKTFGYLPCVCNDNYSLPNKFSYYLFKSLNNIQNYEREYNPDWLKPYFYDNYFECDGQKYVVEMDGGLGHGKKSFGSKEKDEEGLKRDKIKDELALQHNIKVIRVNAEKSDLDFLKENIINSLSNILDLSMVDWEYVYINSTSNLVKKVCEYANENYTFVGNKLVESKYISDIANEFDISNPTVVRYLKTGRNYGWCEYVTCLEKSKIIEDKVYKIYMNNREQGYESIAKQLNVEVWDVANATKRLINNNKITSRRKINGSKK